MASCKKCKQPLTSGIVLHSECYTEMEAEVERLKAELEQLKAEATHKDELMEAMRNYADFADSKNVQLQKQLDASEKSLKIIVEFLSEQRWADCIVNGCEVEDRCGSKECVKFVIGYLKEQEKEQEQ